MAVSLLARLARTAPVAVLVLPGDGARERAHDLGRAPGLEVVSSPRHAAVVVVVGELPRASWQAARLLHDQVPAPRGAVAWSDAAHPFPDAVHVPEGADPVPAVVRLFRALMDGERPGGATLLPAENPVRWKGVGPHGQGGKGMMKGRPYGRGMAMTGEDLRDGLQLDRVQLTVGPFHRWLPPNLELALVLQGDVVQELALRVPPLHREDLPEVFLRARREAVSLRELETARARHHLRATADLLGLHGLRALAERTARARDARSVRRLLPRLLRAVALGTRGVGVLGSEGLAGPAARGAGRATDARCDDPAYEGFEPIRQSRGDAEARFRQRLEEAAQALELAERAGDRLRQPGPPVEGPRGPLDADVDWAGLLAEAGPGQAWDTLLTTLVSLDLDPASLEPSEDFGREHVREEPKPALEADDHDHGHHG